MVTVVLFHSVLGLRQVELDAADRLQSAGHTAVLPDLYASRVANSIDEGLELMSTIGWDTICRRAAAALERVPESAVLAGHSMGAGVVGATWPSRTKCSGVILLHGIADIPDIVRIGTPVTVHVAEYDRFASSEDVATWRSSAKRAGICADTWIYQGVGHFYSDRALSDYDQVATEQTWARVLEFLESVSSP